MNDKNDILEKITKYIKNPYMTRVGSSLTQEEHISSMSSVILEINQEKDAKVLAEIINDLQRKIFEFENRKWKN